MSEKIVQLNEEAIKGQLKELVRGSAVRQEYRSGYYDRNLTTTSGDIMLHVPWLKGVSFETAIIERHRRRERSVEVAPIEMYLAGQYGGSRISQKRCRAARCPRQPSVS